MPKKVHNNSFDYIGAALSDNAINATETAKWAFEGVKVEAIRRQNTPFYFSKGNIFEFISGAKMRVAAAEKGRIFRYDPVSAGRGHFTSPEDLRVFIPGPDRMIQAKVSDDPNFIIKQFCRAKYTGMDRITTSDMYGPVKRILETKARNGTITPAERDVLRNLKPGFYDPVSNTTVEVSNQELYSLKGANGKLDISKVNEYVRQQQNKAFMHECIQNTKSVTLASAISGCVFSSVSNFYKYFRNEQDIKETAKNIGIETAKAAGHGLLSSSIANGIKYVGYKSNNMFIRENVNALVMANGVIDIGRAFYYFKKGEISYNDFLSNVIGTSALSVINIGINYVLAAHPFIKLVSTIVINQIGHSLFKNYKEEPKKPEEKDMGISRDFYLEVRARMEEANKDLNDYLSRNKIVLEKAALMDIMSNPNLDDDEVRDLCDSLEIHEAYEEYKEFDEKIAKGEKIKIGFRRRK